MSDRNDKEIAKEYKCTRCGKQADIFVGLHDPDATEYAMCENCARKWKAEIIFSLGELHNEIKNYEKR